MPKIAEEQWSITMDAGSASIRKRAKELWRYRDLLVLFVRRDFVATYKQTVLGPLWFFLQPVLTALTFTIVFGRIANLSTGAYPRMIFYLSGIAGWAYFADCLTKTSATFISNAHIFSKVYFPRLIVPLSVAISNVMRFLIQLLLLFGFIVYYNMNGFAIHPNVFLFLLPLLVVVMAGLGLGFGILISSLTTKYRDFQFLVAFGVSLLMYLSPVIFPLSTVKPGLLRTIILCNPMSSVIETFRYALLGSENSFDLWMSLLYSTGFMILLLLTSLSVFYRVQRSFMDTV
ncbi:MAG TPA: ABC transporter permease [Bacteroidia bacterium]